MVWIVLPSPICAAPRQRDDTQEMEHRQADGGSMAHSGESDRESPAHSVGWLRLPPRLAPYLVGQDAPFDLGLLLREHPAQTLLLEG